MTAHPDAAPFRMWVADCPFRKNGSPVLGSFGGHAKRIVVIEMDTWNQMCKEIPQLQTTKFEVGT